MLARLRHQWDDSWLLEVVGERDGRTVWFFCEDITAKAGAERGTAVARLVRAGYRELQEQEWVNVDGGWDADVSGR
jgi:1,4-dihydroxy-2-naphthoyl-CoA synthase